MPSPDLTAGRHSFTLSPDGTCAAGVRTAGGVSRLELWHLRPDGEWASRGTNVPVTSGDQLAVTDAGVVYRRTKRRGLHEITRFDGGDPVPVYRHPAHGLFLVPFPHGRVLLVSQHEGRAGFCWLADDGSVTELPWHLERRIEGNVRVGTDAIVLTVAHDTGGSEVLTLDLRDGCTRSVLSVTASSRDQVLAAAGDLIVVVTDAGGESRLGVGRVDDPASFWFPEVFSCVDGGIEAAALDGSAQRLAWVVSQGVRSVVRWCWVADVVGRGVVPVHEFPTWTGTWHGQLRWEGPSLTLAWSAPTRPARLITLAPGTSSDRRPQHTDVDGVRPVLVRGAEGPVEGILYGDLTQSRYVVLALHGGPAARWTFAHDPFLEGLADAGTTILALNQRGSTGYGQAYAAAVVGAWAGPDLQDVLAVGRDLAGRGLRVGLLGVSYGAWLAAQAVKAEPGLWSNAVLLAGFASPEQLREVADLGGLATLDGMQGSTPTWLAGRPGLAGVDVLVVHGTDDRRVPVEQGRALAAEFPDSEFVEVAGAGHDLLGEPEVFRVAEAALREVRETDSEAASPVVPTVADAQLELV